MAITITEFPCDSYLTRRFRVRVHNYSALHVLVTRNPLTVCLWLCHVLSRPRLTFGFGVQFKVYGGYNPAATLQLCAVRRVLIFQLHHTRFSPYILHWLLSQPSATFVGLLTKHEMRKLLRTHHRLAMLNGMPIDLARLLADHFGMNTRGMFVPDIVKAVLGIDMEWDWSVVQSDWEVEELSLDQIKHAAVYAFVCREIGVRIGAWLFNPRLLG